MAFLKIVSLQTRASWRTFKWLFLGALPFKLGNDASQFVGPVFLNLLLGVVENGGSALAGYSYATMMLTLLLAGTLSDNQHFQLVMRAGMQPLLPCYLCPTQEALTHWNTDVLKPPKIVQGQNWVFSHLMSLPHNIVVTDMTKHESFSAPSSQVVLDALLLLPATQEVANVAGHAVAR